MRARVSGDQHGHTQINLDFCIGLTSYEKHHKYEYNRMVLSVNLFI